MWSQDADDIFSYHFLGIFSLNKLFSFLDSYFSSLQILQSKTTRHNLGQIPRQVIVQFRGDEDFFTSFPSQYVNESALPQQVYYVTPLWTNMWLEIPAQGELYFVYLIFKWIKVSGTPSCK